MIKSLSSALIGATMLLASCNNDQPSQKDNATADKYQEGTFGNDLAFLRTHDSVIVLQSDKGMAQVAVSAKYQAKVFTSTADGYEGRSFGWIHYNAFSGPVDAHMNAYGGENRIWLGPEGGKFSLFFQAGDSMTFPHWKTPGDIDTAAWTILNKDQRSVTLEKNMNLVNYAGSHLSLSVNRTISILDRQAIDSILQLAPDSTVKVVGYRTNNILTNIGQEPWTDKTGMPCIWILDMFNPSPATTVVIPYKEPKTKNQKIATTDYFGEIPADRIKYDQNVLFFKADGKSRGKLGIHPSAAKRMAGSYDAQNKVLTLTVFDVDSAGKYLNQEWNTTKPPFSGDAVNTYNDGALADGQQMGPFYEIESVSPAAFLAPGKSMTHQHAVFHFTGNETGLDRISRAWFGVPLDAIRSRF